MKHKSRFILEGRINKKEAREKLKNKENFIASNIFGENYKNKFYVVYSFNHHMPIFIWISLADLQHINKTLYEKIKNLKNFHYDNGIWIKNLTPYKYTTKDGYKIASTTTEKQKQYYKRFNVVSQKQKDITKLLKKLFKKYKITPSDFIYSDAYPKNHINYDKNDDQILKTTPSTNDNTK